MLVNLLQHPVKVFKNLSLPVTNLKNLRNEKKMFQHLTWFVVLDEISRLDFWLEL